MAAAQEVPRRRATTQGVGQAGNLVVVVVTAMGAVTGIGEQ